MGRQIGIVASQVDVDSLLAFFQETTEIALFKSFAESPDALWIDRPQLPSDWMFYVWNKRFPWSPEYSRVSERAYNPEMIGRYYISNKNIAPIVEVDSGVVSKNRAGRIY